MPNREKNNTIIFVFKLCVSLGLIIYLLLIIDWGQAIESINQANKLLLVISPLFWLSSLAFGALRWQTALANSQVRFSYRQACTGYLIGTFYNIFLPGSIGGDAIRLALCVRQTKCETGTATASVLLERIAGVLALLSFLLGVSLFSPATVASLTTAESQLSVTAAAAIGIVVIVVVLMGRRTWMRWLSNKRDNRIWSFVYSGGQALGALRAQTLGAIFALSVLFQGTRIMGMFVLSRAIGLNLPLKVFFAVIPLVYLATLLPISLGGLGVREGTLVLLLPRFGAATLDAVTLSFLIYLSQVFLGALGGLIQLKGSFANRDLSLGKRT